MKKIIYYTKELQKEHERRKKEKLIFDELDKLYMKKFDSYTLETLNMLAKKYNCNVNDIVVDDAYYVYVYYLNGKQIYWD